MKRALLIGINTYKRKPLDGCVNDVEMMRDLLIGRFDFPKANTTLIKDRDATRDGILGAFDELVAQTQPDDIVVIHYAGHGSQMYLEPGAVNDEASGMANTIVPIDTDRDREVNKDITDDEINAVLERLAQKTPHTTLIFDCCHSATITRGEVADGAKSRSIEPGAGSAGQRSRPARAAAKRSQKPGPSGWVPLADSYVLIAGCRDKESSYETPPRKPKEPHGALSWSLCEALREMPAGMTYRDLFEPVAVNVIRMWAGELQHPQLEGRIDREVFGVAVNEPIRFVSIGERLGSQVTLRAGAAMGIKAGTRWTVYRPETKRPTNDAKRGEIEITQVRGVDSTGRVIPESDKAIVARSRAAVGERSFGGERLPVLVDAAHGDAAAAMTEALRASPLVQTVAAAVPTVVRVRMQSAQNSEGRPAEYWAIETAGGSFPSSTSASAIDDVRRNLETIARYRHALSIENSASPLRDAIKFVVKRTRGDNGWVTAKPNDDGVIAFEDGDAVGFSITNGSKMAVYVTLLDFSRSGAISQLYPPLGARELVEPKVTFEIGTDPNKRKIRLRHEEYAISEVETFKLIATTNEGDFWPLTQPGVRAAAVWKAPAEARTTRGAGEEEEAVAPVDDWTTFSSRYVVRPPKT
jgi:hypothetical protein